MSLKLVWDSEKKYLNLETSFLEVDGTLFFDFNNLLEFLNYNEYVYKHSTNALKIDKKDLESFKANIIHHSVQCENIIINCFNFSLNSSEGLKLYDLTMIKESNAALTEIDINDKLQTIWV